MQATSHLGGVGGIAEGTTLAVGAVVAATVLVLAKKMIAVVRMEAAQSGDNVQYVLVSNRDCGMGTRDTGTCGAEQHQHQ